MFVEEVVKIAGFKGVEEFVVFFLGWCVEVEVVHGGTVRELATGVVAGDHEIVNGVVGRACLDGLDGLIHCHIEFDASGEIAVFGEGADKLEELVVLGDRAVEDSEEVDVVLELRDVSVQCHDG
jgi:hypothetical protein